MLGKPNATQIKFFNANEGGVSKPGSRCCGRSANPNLTYKLVAQSPLVKLEPYFGKTAQFPLETTLPVKKGDVDRPDRALLGAGARARLRQGHLLARQPAQEPVHEHERPDDRTRRSARPCSTSASTRPRA